MKRTIKAVLLSAFAAPGAGHFFLKHYLMGAILLMVAFSGLFSIVINILEKALMIADMIETRAQPFTLNEVMALVSQQVQHSEAQQMSWSLYALFTAWLVGIVDSFRLGYKLDKLQT